MKNIPLKILSSLVLICLSQISCDSKESISGRINGVEENTTIYLIQPENLRDVAASYLGKVIDSAEVNVDGNFKFLNLPKK
jgi:hypothetical protein